MRYTIADRGQRRGHKRDLYRRRRNAVVCTDPGSDFGAELDVKLRDQNDTLMVDAGADTDVAVNGGDGDDNITSIGESRDTISGYLGADVLDGGPGADTIFGSNNLNLDETTGNTIRGGQGNDVLYGGNGPDVFDEQTTANGSDFMSGFGGSDVVTYAQRTNPVTVNLDLALGVHRMRS